jgi:hypothetical protein
VIGGTGVHLGPTALTTDERATLDAVLDVLIPAGSGMPAARDVEVSTRWIDEALRLRPDLRGHLDACLAAVAGADDPESALRAFATAEPDAFGAVGVLVSGSYYMDDRSRAALGYPGQEERRLVDDVDEYAEMLERVLDRGPIFRPTPQEGPHV